MSIITKIDSIPVFTTKAQALSWGRLNGYVGYREQFHFGKKGYIAGKTSGDIAFEKYPAQTVTATATAVLSLAFKNQQETTVSTSNGVNIAVSSGGETSSSGDGGDGGSTPPSIPTQAPPQQNQQYGKPKP